jgi:hypothetical protein
MTSPQVVTMRPLHAMALASLKEQRAEFNELMSTASKLRFARISQSSYDSSKCWGLQGCSSTKCVGEEEFCMAILQTNEASFHLSYQRI